MPEEICKNSINHSYGMQANTGTALSGIAHLRQSITDILTTPIGSRVMRRDYGSYLFELLDYTGNSNARLQLMAATADALIRWEPRLELTSVTTDIGFDGKTQINLSGIYNECPSNFSISMNSYTLEQTQ